MTKVYTVQTEGGDIVSVCGSMKKALKVAVELCGLWGCPDPEIEKGTYETTLTTSNNMITIRLHHLERS